MWWKPVLIWLALMVGAIVNGGVREKLIVPQMGAAWAHVVSTLLLCIIVLVITWGSIGWMAPRTVQYACFIGVAWLCMTLTFEFGVGYFISHRTWAQMFEDYDLLRGRVWVLVPIVTLIAPVWMARLRGLLP